MQYVVPTIPQDISSPVSTQEASTSADSSSDYASSSTAADSSSPAAIKAPVDPARAAARGAEEAEVAKGQRTAVITGAVSILFGVRILARFRGAMSILFGAGIALNGCLEVLPQCCIGAAPGPGPG